MDKIVDVHFHVGLAGDKWPQMGGMSPWYKEQLVFKIFLLYADLKPGDVCDEKMDEAILHSIRATKVDKVVCLALDPVYDTNGNRQEKASNVWTDNSYVFWLRDRLPEKVLPGASVHPLDPKFRERVEECVAKGAVLLKWLPSAQQFTLDDPRVADAMKFLATVNKGKALPLLLHTGGEYAIPSSNPRTFSNDFLTWGFWDKFFNIFRFGDKKWNTPNIAEIDKNIRAALDAGTVIIFAHCGLPYFTPKFLTGMAEHSDFEPVKKYLESPGNGSWRCFADVSAICTPGRAQFIPEVEKLPKEKLLFGSDYPTPVFLLKPNDKDIVAQFEELRKGHVEHLVIPAGNLLDVNLEQLQIAFPQHPMFTNFSRM
jgi:predicted TIM-barrel fold metal-dependent hydrolase